MKKLMLVILLSASGHGFTQTFGEVGTVWRSGYFWGATNGPGQPCSNSNYTCLEYIQDSIVGTDTLQLISRHARAIGTCGGFHDDFSDDSLFAKIDSGQVFYGSPGNLKLYYDFNLIVADSFVVDVQYAGIYGTDTVQVIAVDSVVLNGTNRKRIMFEDFSYHWDPYSIVNGSGMVWIEGVGDTVYGTFVTNIYVNFVNYNLDCFVESSTTWIGSCDPAEPCPWIPLSLEVSEELELNLYPNPVQDFLRFEFQFTTPISIQVFNLNGQVVFERADVYNGTILDLSHLDKGVYLLETQSPTYKSTKKIVKL